MFYPILSGFWTSTGVSAGILFVLMYCHNKYTHPAWPFWISALIGLLVYASPLVGIWRTRKHFTKKLRGNTVRPLMRQCITGAIIGAIVMFIAATILLPIVGRG